MEFSYDLEACNLYIFFPCRSTGLQKEGPLRNMARLWPLACLWFYLLSSFIYQCVLHSKFVIKMYFVPQRWNLKNKRVVYAKWPLRNMANLQPLACLWFHLNPQIHVASSPVRSLNNLNCLVVGHRFCLLVFV